MVISTDNKKIKIFLPRNVSGLFKYSINNPLCAKYLYLLEFCLFVCFLRILSRKENTKKQKGPGSSQISRLCYRSWGSFCFRMKSRLEMASRRPGQEWVFSFPWPLPPHLPFIFYTSLCLLLSTPFSFLLPVFSLTPSSFFYFLFVLSFLIFFLDKNSVLPGSLQHCCLYFVFCIQFNNCLHTFLYLIIELFL